MSIERASRVDALYDELKHGYIETGKVEKLLKGSDISMLTDFLENWDVIQKFNHRYYGDGAPKVVLCGINPGRLGAGKTGVPFIDFASLSAMIRNGLPASFMMWFKALAWKHFISTFM